MKADIAGLKSDVAVLKTDVAELKSDVSTLKTDVAGLKVNLAETEKKLRGEIRDSSRRLALAVIQTNDRIDKVAIELREEMRAINSNVGRTLDSAVSRMEILWRETVSFPRILDDHDRRITALEARQTR